MKSRILSKSEPTPYFDLQLHVTVAKTFTYHDEPSCPREPLSMFLAEPEDMYPSSLLGAMIEPDVRPCMALRSLTLTVAQIRNGELTNPATSLFSSVALALLV